MSRVPAGPTPWRGSSGGCMLHECARVRMRVCVCARGMGGGAGGHAYHLGRPVLRPRTRCRGRIKRGHRLNWQRAQQAQLAKSTTGATGEEHNSGFLRTVGSGGITVRRGPGPAAQQGPSNPAPCLRLHAVSTCAVLFPAPCPLITWTPAVRQTLCGGAACGAYCAAAQAHVLRCVLGPGSHGVRLLPAARPTPAAAAAAHPCICRVLRAGHPQAPCHLAGRAATPPVLSLPVGAVLVAGEAGQGGHGRVRCTGACCARRGTQVCFRGGAGDMLTCV